MQSFDRCTRRSKALVCFQIFVQDHQFAVAFNDTRLNHDDFREKIRTAEKLNSYVNEQIKDHDKYLIFLDEIQHVRSFEKVLASFGATLNCSIYITGSNSKLLMFFTSHKRGGTSILQLNCLISPSTVIRHIKGRLPLGVSLPFFT